VFAVGVQHGDVIAVFVQTGSLYLFASPVYFDEIIHCAVEEFLERQIVVSSVLGHSETALLFAECWKERTQSEVTFAGRDYLYEITSIGGERSAKGSLRRAGSIGVPELKPSSGSTTAKIWG